MILLKFQIAILQVSRMNTEQMESSSSDVRAQSEIDTRQTYGCISKKLKRKSTLAS